MSVFFPFALLFTIQLLCETFVQFTGLPVPGSVIGAVVLLGLLFKFPQLHEQIAPSCHVLIKNMLLLYVPISVGLMDRYQELRDNFWMLAATLVFSTLATAFLTAYSFQTLNKNEGHQNV